MFHCSEAWALSGQSRLADDQGWITGRLDYWINGEPAKIMCRILRKIAKDQAEQIGDITTLIGLHVFEVLVKGKQQLGVG